LFIFYLILFRNGNIVIIHQVSWATIKPIDLRFLHHGGRIVTYLNSRRYRNFAGNTLMLSITILCHYWLLSVSWCTGYFGSFNLWWYVIWCTGCFGSSNLWCSVIWCNGYSGSSNSWCCIKSLAVKNWCSHYFLNLQTILIEYHSIYSFLWWNCSLITSLERNIHCGGLAWRW